MKMLALSRHVLILLTVVVFADSQACNNVIFEKEPPDELTCNPFKMTQQDVLWKIQMECRIVIPMAYRNVSSYTIIWCHRDIQGSIGTQSATLNSIIGNRIKSVIGNGWVNKPFSESMLGEYWCQVMNTDNTNMYGISNVVIIHHPECYNMSLDRCMEIRHIMSDKCADSFRSVTNTISICSLVPSSTIPRVSSMLQDSAMSNTGTSDDSQTITEVASSPPKNCTLLTIYNIHSTIYITSVHTSEMTINSTSLSTSPSRDDQETNNGLTNLHIAIITSTLIMILGILIITSCLVMVCVYLTKKKKKIKYNLKTPNAYETVDEIQTLPTIDQSEVNSSLPLAEPADYLDPVSVQMALQDESQTVVLSTSNEPAYNELTPNNEEENYDRLKHSHETKVHHVGSGNIDKGSNEEYSSITDGNKSIYNTLDLDSVVMETGMDNLYLYNTIIPKEAEYDSLKHTGSGNNHTGSNDDSTTNDISSHVYDVLGNNKKIWSSQKIQLKSKRILLCSNVLLIFLCSPYSKCYQYKYIPVIKYHTDLM